MISSADENSGKCRIENRLDLRAGEKEERRAIGMGFYQKTGLEFTELYIATFKLNSLSCRA
ncbi:MAG: hypothetical protein C4530_20675 [Desulfobacteraceae bacterium]|nr:MAG: hypothetical protein C4530_20675 [Desulfobacteraceae bacterium]